MYFDMGLSQIARPFPRAHAAVQRKLDATLAEGAHPLVMRCGAFGDVVLLTVLLRQLPPAARDASRVENPSCGRHILPLQSL